MVWAKVMKSEFVKDEKRDTKYEVFMVEVRLGVKVWNVRRKYEAFRKLDRMLRSQFPNEGLPGLPEDASGREKALIKEFIDTLINSPKLINTKETRSFFEVPSSRQLLDLSNDATRSILSVPLASIPGINLPKGAPKVTIAHIVLLVVLLAAALPLSGIPSPSVRPFAAAFVFPFCLWQLVQRDGMIDAAITSRYKENAPFVRNIIRPADSPVIWIAIGVFVGYGLGAGTSTAPVTIALVNLAIVTAFFAIINLFFTLTRVEKIKPKAL